MSAIDKTKSLQRLDVPIEDLHPNPNNPNRMSGRAFDLLVDNLQKTGLTDPILVRPRPEGGYQIVGGHHRWEGARYLGFETVPCTVITDPDFDAEAEAFQVVRMNVIRGKMDPAAFFNLYGQVADKYGNEVLQDMFGFAEASEFQKLINQSAASLPPELQAKFKEAAKEVKTIDGLAKLLNEMFSKYGSSLPFGFMVLDYGGQKSVWVQVSKHTMAALQTLGMRCRDELRTLDDLLGHVVQAMAAGDLEEPLRLAIKKSPEVVIPEAFVGISTKEALAAEAAM